MIASVLKWVIVFLALSNFGYMTFDGTRALIKGDYIRRGSGTYAGQLGPWSKVASALGIDPESTKMKAIFVIWGVAGLICAICFIMNLRWVSNALLVYNILSLWYLIPGTISSFLQIVLLIIRRSLG